MTFRHFYSTAAVVFDVMIWSKDSNEKGASDPFYDECLVYWASNIEAEVVDCIFIWNKKLINCWKLNDNFMTRSEFPLSWKMYRKVLSHKSLRARKYKVVECVMAIKMRDLWANGGENFPLPNGFQRSACVVHANSHHIVIKSQRLHFPTIMWHEWNPQPFDIVRVSKKQLRKKLFTSKFTTIKLGIGDRKKARFFTPTWRSFINFN